MNTDAQIIFCTVPDKDNASRIARLLVEQKHAACVNIVPQITSVYEWQGQTEEDSEYLLIIKTQAARYQTLQDCLLSLHPYDTPEIIAMDIATGLPDYLNWIKDVTKSS